MCTKITPGILRTVFHAQHNLQWKYASLSTYTVGTKKGLYKELELLFSTKINYIFSLKPQRVFWKIRQWHYHIEAAEISSFTFCETDPNLTYFELIACYLFWLLLFSNSCRHSSLRCTQHAHSWLMLFLTFLDSTQKYPTHSDRLSTHSSEPGCHRATEPTRYCSQGVAKPRCIGETWVIQKVCF